MEEARRVVGDLFTLARKLNLKVQSEDEKGLAVVYNMNISSTRIRLEVAVSYDQYSSAEGFSVDPQTLDILLPQGYCVVMEGKDEYLNFREINMDLIGRLKEELQDERSKPRVDKIYKRMVRYMQETFPNK